MAHDVRPQPQCKPEADVSLIDRALAKQFLPALQEHFRLSLPFPPVLMFGPSFRSQVVEKHEKIQRIEEHVTPRGA